MDFIFFILASFFAFFVPGRVILGKTQFSFLQKITVSIVCGIVLWAFQAIVFGYMHTRWLSYAYLVVFLALFIKEKYYLQKLEKKSSIDIPSILIVVIGAIAQILPYFTTGWKTASGIIITAHNTADHIWHGALVNELIKHFPPNEPSLAGVVLKDYHYFYNLITANLISVFHLSFLGTQFDGMYFLAPILLGSIGFIISQKIYPSKFFSRLFLFLLFFGGNASGWVMVLLGHGFNWGLSSLIIDASKFVDSPPFAYAIILGLTGFFLLLNFRENLPNRFIILCSLLFGSIMEYKIHAGIPFLAGFGAFSAIFVLKKKFKPIISFILAAGLAFALLKINSSNAAGLAFVPVDIPRDFINQPLLHLTDWQLRWNIFFDHHNVIRLIEYGIFMSFVYFVIQFGILLLGLVPFPKTINKLGLGPSVFLFGAICCALFFGLFFYQTVGGANIWEFFLVCGPLLSLVFALTIVLFLEKMTIALRLIVIILIIIITIPQWLISTKSYIKGEFFNGFHGISNEQKQSYDFINSNVPTNSLIMLAGPEFPSFADISNIFIKRDIYYSGGGVRQITTPVIKKRKDEEKSISTSQNSIEISIILKSNKINYLYYYGRPSNKEALINANLDIVFVNKAATIFHIK